MPRSRRRHSTLSAPSVGLMFFNAYRWTWSKNDSTDSRLQHGIVTRRAHACIGLVDRVCPVKQEWLHHSAQQFTPQSKIFSKSILMVGNFRNQVGFQTQRKKFYGNAGKKRSKSSMKHLGIRIGKKTSTKKPGNSRLAR